MINIFKFNLQLFGDYSASTLPDGTIVEGSGNNNSETTDNNNTNADTSIVNIVGNTKLANTDIFGSLKVARDKNLNNLQEVVTADQLMQGSTSTTSGVAGLIPAPTAGMDNRFLNAAGKWQQIFVSGLPVGFTFTPPLYWQGVDFEGCLLLNGALIERDKYPDLWNFVNNNLTDYLLEDDEWLTKYNDSNTDDSKKYCGFFSKGDGSTTFRIPGSLSENTIYHEYIKAFNIQMQDPDNTKYIRDISVLAGQLQLFNSDNTTSLLTGLGGIVAGNLAQNGWVKFENGLILQWGYQVSKGTYQFPIAYPNKAFTIVAGNITKQGDAIDNAFAYIVSNQSFYYASKSAGAVGGHAGAWVSVGN